MNLQVIAVGKIKEKFYKEALEEYIKRLSRYCKLTITELEDEKAPEKLSSQEMIQIKDKEGRRILEKIHPSSYVIALAIEGKGLSSEDFAQKLEDLAVAGDSQVSFVIGGSLGLSQEVLQRADFKLSFSKMTFPHQLMRVVLLEQIYRGFRILRGEPYHK